MFGLDLFGLLAGSRPIQLNDRCLLKRNGLSNLTGGKASRLDLCISVGCCRRAILRQIDPLRRGIALREFDDQILLWKR